METTTPSENAEEQCDDENVSGMLSKRKREDEKLNKESSVETALAEEESFAVEVSSGCVNENTGLVSASTECAVAELPNLSLQRPVVHQPGKKLLVLDINGLLADIVPNASRWYEPDVVISNKYVFKRPYCNEFIEFCFERFNVGIWSSRVKRNLDELIDFLFEDCKHKLVFCWDQSHCTNTGYTTLENRDKPLFLKEIRKLWENIDDSLPWRNGEYNKSNTLMIDDSPYKALRNPAYTTIFPHTYRYKDYDSSLGPRGEFRVYLERLADAENVQEFVANNPFGKRAITERSASWSFYKRIVDGNSSWARDVAGSSFR